MYESASHTTPTVHNTASYSLNNQELEQNKIVYSIVG